MKKIIILSVLLLTSSLYAQHTTAASLGGEYNFSTVADVDAEGGNMFLNLLLPHEAGGPAHSLTAGLKVENIYMLSSGFTYGFGGGIFLGLTTKSMFDLSIQAAPILGYSFIDDKLFQIDINPATIAFNPLYTEGDNFDFTQVIDFRSGVSFSFSEFGLRNESAIGYSIGANVKWGEMRFNSALKGFRTDLGFGISFFRKASTFHF